MVYIMVKSYQGVSVESKNVSIENNTKTVFELKQLVGESFKMNPTDFELVRKGLRMKDDEGVDDLKEATVLYALKSVKKVEHVAESVDESTMKHVIQSMKQLLSKPHTKDVLETEMKSRGLLECMIEAAPAFGSDSVAIDVLSNAALLVPIFVKKNGQPEKFLDEHKSLVHACLFLIEEVRGEKGGATTDDAKQDSKALYSIDHMSDQEDEDEEEMETDEDEISNTTRRNLNNLRTLIRPFGAAMGSVGSSNPGSPMPPFPSNPHNTPSTSNNPTNTITSDFFRQAMRAINIDLNPVINPLIIPQQPANAPQGASNAPVISEAQLQQMSELGVSNSTLASTLLTQTNGDIQAAIALYYDSQEFNQ